MNFRTISNFKKNKEFLKENSDFIVKNSLESKVRNIRVHLLNDMTDKFFFDIIIRNSLKENYYNKRKANIRNLKKNLGVLSEIEMKDEKEEEEIQNLLNRNLYYYSEISDLLIDLNFKHFQLTNYNSAFLRDGTEIAEFKDLGKENEELFIAELKYQNDYEKINSKIKKIINDMKNPTFYRSQYKNILEKKSLQLMLNNIINSKEFEIKNKQILETEELIPAETKINFNYNREISFKKTLNKFPLRKRESDLSALPQIPNIFQICQNSLIKTSSLRNLFKSPFSQPFLRNLPKNLYLPNSFKYLNKDTSCSNSLDFSEFNTFLTVKKDLSISKSNFTKCSFNQYSKNNMKNNSIEMDFRNSSLESKNKLHNSNVFQTTSSIYSSDNNIDVEKKLAKYHKQKKINPLSFPSIKEAYNTTNKSSNRNKELKEKFKNFYLSEESADKIRKKYKLIYQNSNDFRKRNQSIEDQSTFQKQKHNSLNILIKKPIIKQLMQEYNYSPEKMDKIISEYYLMGKASKHTRIPENLYSNKNSHIYFAHILRKTIITPNEYCSFLENENFDNSDIYYEIIKEYYYIFKEKTLGMFLRLISSIGISSKKINLSQFLKIRYFLIDMKFKQTEAIDFCLKFISKDSKNINKLIQNLLPSWVNLQQKVFIVDKYLESFLYCNIINEEGHFFPDNFYKVYSLEIMNIRDLLRLILG